MKNVSNTVVARIKEILAEKEIYVKIIIERHNIVYKITMQKTLESEFGFSELFVTRKKRSGKKQF